MTTVIKRMKVNIEFETGDQLECFHTSGDQVQNEPPTIITYNGREYEGEVDLQKQDKEFIIIIRMHE